MKKLKINIKPVKRPSEKPPAKPGNWLNDFWNIGAEHCLFSSFGTWYHHLTIFPGALCDPKGFIKFDTKGEYLKYEFAGKGVEINVPGGISNLSDYKTGKPSVNW
jgi:5-methylcytosine-specific restriction enzyme A